MQFEADTKPMREILVVGQHVIPRYQRRYAWDDLNIKEFWDDLRKNPNGHFLGSMVVSGPRDGEREVIDGQQRITTTLILLSVLRDEYERLGEQGLVEGISHYIKHQDVEGKYHFRLENRDETAMGRLEEAVLIPEKDRQYPNGEYGDSREVTARNRFTELIHEAQKGVEDPVMVVSQMRDAVLGAEAVYVWSNTRKNAFGIFETLNDRGQSLSVADLVKNTVIGRLPEAAGKQDEKLWTNAINFVESSEIEGIDLEQFLYYHWNSIAQDGVVTGDPVEKKKIRRSVEEFLGEEEGAPERAREFLKEFLNSACIYDAFGKTLATGGSADAWNAVAEGGRWKRQTFDDISWHLYGILVTGASQPFMLILVLMRKYLEENSWLRTRDLLKFLKAIKDYQFRWSIAEKPSTSTHRRLYRKAATSVFLSKKTEDLKDALTEFQNGAFNYGATDIQFQAGLNKLVYSNTRKKDSYKIRYIFREFELANPSKARDFSRLQTIEHLEPQGNKSESTNRNSWVFKLGNLMLLPSEVNSALPNDFSGKAPKISDFTHPADKVLRQAIEEESWTFEDADRRQKTLEKYACTIWYKEEKKKKSKK